MMSCMCNGVYTYINIFLNYISILNVTGDMWFISAVWQTEGQTALKRRSRLRSECCAYSKNSVPPAEFT